LKKKSKVRIMSIKMKVSLAMGAMVMLLCMVLGFNLYSNQKKNIMALAVDQTEMAAAMAADRIDADAAKDLTSFDTTTDSFKLVTEQLIEAREKCGMAYLYVLVANGGKVYYGADADVEGAAIGEEFEVSYEELKGVFGGQKYVQDYIDETEDGDLISAYVPLIASNGSVSAIIGCDYDATFINSCLKDAIITVCVTTAACFILAIVVLNILLTIILRNLKVINAKVEEVASNEGDLTQQISVRSGDEIEQIADNVNAMLESIRKIMLSVSHNSNQVEASSRKVASELTGAQENIVDISATMEQMSAGMQETSASLFQINESVELTWKYTEDVREEVKSGNDMTERSRQEAEEVRVGAVKTSEEVQAQAKQMIEVINSKIQDSRAVEEINTLTQDIINIASQTNMLSLNASIEAARAGESGRGFAVVADEIGKLATDSSQAANQISEVSAKVIEAVEALAKASKEMVEFLEQSTVKGYDALVKTSTDYRDTVTSINEMVQRLSANTEDSLKNMENIKESINAVTIAVEECAKGVTDISEISVSLTDNVESVAREAGENKEIAEALYAEVNKFVLE